MSSGGGGVHAAYSPSGLTGLFQCCYVLVSPVYHDCFGETGRIREYFDVFLGYIPLFAYVDGRYLNELFSVCQKTYQRTVFSITFGYQCIGEQIERNGLVTLYAQGVGNAFVSIPFVVAHQWGFTVPILIVLQDIFEQSQTFFDLIPLETAGGIFVRVSIFKGIFVVEQVFHNLYLLCRDSLGLLFGRCLFQ